MSKTKVAKIRRQLTGMEVTKSFNVVITTTIVETDVAPSMNVVKGEVLIGFAANLGHGLSKVSIGNNLSRNLGILAVTTRVVGTPQMVFTNSIMTTHVNKTANRPSITIIVI
jgi:hypothetical protein